MKNNINTYDIACLALKSAPRYIEDADLLTDLICQELATDDRRTVRNIVWLALDAAISGDFRANAEKILREFEKKNKIKTCVK